MLQLPTFSLSMTSVVMASLHESLRHRLPCCCAHHCCRYLTTPDLGARHCLPVTHANADGNVDCFVKHLSPVKRASNEQRHLNRAIQTLKSTRMARCRNKDPAGGKRSSLNEDMSLCAFNSNRFPPTFDLTRFWRYVPRRACRAPTLCRTEVCSFPDVPGGTHQIGDNSSSRRYLALLCKGKQQ